MRDPNYRSRPHALKTLNIRILTKYPAISILYTFTAIRPRASTIIMMRSRAALMETEKFVAMVFMLGLLVSCAPMSPYEAINSPVLRKAVQSARTRSDHYALMGYFENLAQEMQAKVEEQRKLLKYYQAKSYLYGRQAQDQQSHTWALMRKYEQAVEKSLAEADSHRRIAAEFVRETPASPIQPSNSAIFEESSINN